MKLPSNMLQTVLKDLFVIGIKLLHVAVYWGEGGGGTVVQVRWTAGQQIERLILHQGHDSLQKSSH